MMITRSTRALWVDTVRLMRPYLLDLGTGVWLAIYTKYNGISSSNPVLRFSDDEGVTWTAENTKIGGGSVTGLPSQSTYDYVQSLPILAPNGDLLLHLPGNGTSSRNGTTQLRSTNGGSAWSSDGKIQGDNTILGGDDWCTDGTNLYATAFIDPGANLTAPYTPILLKSADSGATWTDVDMVASGFNEHSINFAANGDLISVMRSDDGLTTKQVTSTDIGATWGSPVDLTAQMGLLQKPVTHRVGDVLYLLGRRAIGTFGGTSDTQYGRQQTEFYKSDDNGVTWRGPWTVDGRWVWGCGYTGMLMRSNGDAYVLDYVALGASAAHIVEHVVRLP